MIRNRSEKASQRTWLLWSLGHSPEKKRTAATAGTWLQLRKENKRHEGQRKSKQFGFVNSLEVTAKILLPRLSQCMRHRAAYLGSCTSFCRSFQWIRTT